MPGCRDQHQNTTQAGPAGHQCFGAGRCWFLQQGVTTTEQQLTKRANALNETFHFMASSVNVQ